MNPHPSNPSKSTTDELHKTTRPNKILSPQTSELEHIRTPKPGSAPPSVTSKTENTSKAVTPSVPGAQEVKTTAHNTKNTPHPASTAAPKGMSPTVSSNMPNNPKTANTAPQTGSAEPRQIPTSGSKLPSTKPSPVVGSTSNTLPPSTLPPVVTTQQQPTPSGSELKQIRTSGSKLPSTKPSPVVGSTSNTLPPSTLPPATNQQQPTPSGSGNIAVATGTQKSPGGALGALKKALVTEEQQKGVPFPRSTTLSEAVSGHTPMSEEMLDALKGGDETTLEPFSRARSSVGAPPKTGSLQVTPGTPAKALDVSGMSGIRDVDGIELFKRRRSSIATDPETLKHMQQALEHTNKKLLKPKTEIIDEQFLLSKGERQLKSVLAPMENRPKKKTTVKFCDTEGIQLATTRVYYDQEEAPEVPLYATAYLKLEDHDANLPQEDPDQKVLRPAFSQPGAVPNFMGRVHLNKVALEFCLVNDEEMTVTGTVRVANISFSKSVTVRYTVDNWKTVEDVKANYVYYSNDGATDRFSFVIQLPSTFGPGGQMQFALRYDAGPEIFWDNNSGHNYKVDCYTREMLQTAANMNYMSSLYPNFTWLHYL